MGGHKGIRCAVTMLDESVLTFNLPLRAMGEELRQEVVKSMQMFETDYFGLEFTHKEGFQAWLDLEKPISKQCPLNKNTYEFQFQVKFYTPDPTLLEDEFTRYQFALQVRQDLATGRLQCNFNTTAMLVAYIAQAELGDIESVEGYRDGAPSSENTGYLHGTQYVPNQGEELNVKIVEYHINLKGVSPADADLTLLDTARKTDFYGIVLYPAKDHEGAHLSLAVIESGILVFQNSQRINTFSWAKIRKLSFKRLRFLIKLAPSEEHDYRKNMVAFHMASRNSSKHFWKVCVEHHSFFRATRAPATMPRPRRRRVSLSRGSSFRYTGRTQKQLLDHVKENFVRPTPFERTLSSRASSRRQLGASASTTLNSRHRDMGASMEAGSSLSSGSHMIASTSGLSPTHTGGATSDHSTTGGMSSFHPGGRTGATITTVHTADYPNHSPVGASSELLPAGSPPMKDRNISEPLLSEAAHLKPQAEAHRLARAPDYLNIPENTNRDEGSNTLDRSYTEAVDNIPEEVEGDINTEPRHFTPSSGLTNSEDMLNAATHGVVRIHSETDAADLRYNPRDYGGSNGAILEQTPVEPPHAALMGDEMNARSLPFSPTNPLPPANAQFSLGSSDLIINGNGTRNAESGQNMKNEDDTYVAPKRHSLDKAYHIAKELVMTERAYHKDLEVIVKWFRNAVTEVTQDDAVAVMETLFSYIEPIFQAHTAFLDDCELRLTQWEGKTRGSDNSANSRRIGDVLVEHFDSLEVYRNYVINLVGLMLDLHSCMDSHREFARTVREFECEKVCYLPLYCILLKPAHRLQHYELVLSKLITHYQMSHYDYADCKSAYSKVTEMLGSLRAAIIELENTEKVLEVQQDIVGLEGLVQAGRYFMREGCLQKMSRTGFQQRLFLLMSDVLVYTSRTSNTQLQFKIHGQMPIEGMSLEESDNQRGGAFSFSIYQGNRCLIVSASSEEEKSKWMEDINMAVRSASMDGGAAASPATLPQIVKTGGSTSSDADGDADVTSPTSDKQISHRANTTMHVCWHRNTSVSMRDIQNAVKHQLSGYLLRKFKNSNGWQKLWVVFTNFCLFFYKSYMDDYPLASLPLLGYSVGKPSASDGIHKDFVFKLQFKNHVYFFRAESEYIYDRWVEVINSATRGAHRTRMFSRMESIQ